VLARSSQLRDRWCYFVRLAALEQHLTSSGSSALGRDVVNAVQQVQDAATELLQLLQQLTESVTRVIEAAAAGGGDGSGSSGLQQLLLQHEAAEELAELLAWCEMQGHSSSSSSDGSHGLLGSDGLLAADALLLERAWRLSFAPFAAKGLVVALGMDGKASSSSSSRNSSTSGDSGGGSSEVLEMMDLGLRLEAGWELGQALRMALSARLSLEGLMGQ
jgi:hypothetical protein